MRKIVFSAKSESEIDKTRFVSVGWLADIAYLT